MSKAVNAALIDGLARELDGVESCVVIGTSAMTVEEVSGLRAKLREQDFKMRVVKNSLAKVAFEKVGLAGLEAVLNGPSAVVHGGEGAIAISKVVVEEKILKSSGDSANLPASVVVGLEGLWGFLMLTFIG